MNRHLSASLHRAAYTSDYWLSPDQTLSGPLRWTDLSLEQSVSVAQSGSGARNRLILTPLSANISPRTGGRPVEMAGNGCPQTTLRSTELGPGMCTSGTQAQEYGQLAVIMQRHAEAELCHLGSEAHV